ncbi:hypothetical protein O6H91_10G088500 [Diphasiastrum complanatum]|uniref:Uncharacterized protein n=1 Tax=Diphasiastrum complanatum TaxID=34168 RepID=A0ACC2CJL0_DIPCM|nr:hypothetical protein O6H91_10G088500 [Diphasiastrum complanatum]
MATSLLSPAINGSYSVRIMAGSSLSTMASLRAVPVGARCLHGLASPSLSEASSRSFLLKSSFNGESLASRGPALPRKRIPVRYAGSPVCLAAAADAEGSDLPAVSSSVKKESLSFAEKNPALVTGFFFFTWYFLNVIFNILTRRSTTTFHTLIFVSVIHLLVGVAYCLVSWALGAPKRAPINKELLLLLTPVSFCHALGHVMTNVSFCCSCCFFYSHDKSLGAIL